MKVDFEKKFSKRILILFLGCLVISAMYIVHSLYSFYSFDSLLQEESPAKIVHCSLDICSSEDELTVPIDVESDLFDCLIRLLRSEQYTKPLASILGHTVSAYRIESYPFYRILFQHEDYHRTEVVVNGSFLLIGSTTGPGLTVYQASDDSLLGGLNALF